MVEEFKEVKAGEEEVLTYDLDPEAVEEEPKSLLPYPFRTGALVKNFPKWVGISHVAKREAMRDKRDGKTFGCSYEDIMKAHEVAKVKSPYPLPRSRVTGKEGGPDSVLPHAPKRDEVVTGDADLNFDDLVFDETPADGAAAATEDCEFDPDDMCFEELPGDAAGAPPASTGAHEATSGTPTPEPVTLEDLSLEDMNFEPVESSAGKVEASREDMKWTDEDFEKKEATFEDKSDWDVAASPSTPAMPETPFSKDGGDDDDKASSARSSFTRGSLCLPKEGEADAAQLDEVRRALAAQDAAEDGAAPPETPTREAPDGADDGAGNDGGEDHAPRGFGSMGKVFRSPSVLASPGDGDRSLVEDADAEFARLKAKMDRSLEDLAEGDDEGGQDDLPSPPPPPVPAPAPPPVVDVAARPPETLESGPALTTSPRVAGETLDRFVKNSDVDTFFRGAGADVVRSHVHTVLTSTDESEIVDALLAVRALARKQERVRSDVAKAGVVGTVVSLLRDSSVELQRAAAGLLWTISVNDVRNKVLIVASGVLDPLVALLSSLDDGVREEAAGALWSLAINDCNKVAIVAADALKPLAAMLHHLDEEADVQKRCVEHAAGVVQNLAMLDEHQMPIYETHCVHALVRLLTKGTDVGKENAAGALRNLATNDDLEVKIASMGAPEPLCALLFHGTPLCAANAHGALQNMTFNAESRRRVADAFGRPDLAEDPALLRRKLSAAVQPPAKAGQSGLRGLPFVGDCAC